MPHLLRRRWISTALVAVLAQLGGSFAVFCDEGRDRQVLEFLTDCCGASDEGPSRDESAPDERTQAPAGESCGPCHDVPVVQILPRQDGDGDAGRLDLAPAGVASWQRPPAAPVLHEVARACAGPPLAVRLVGTVVLTC